MIYDMIYETVDGMASLVTSIVSLYLDIEATQVNAKYRLFMV